jgi:hypothetical protein
MTARQFWFGLLVLLLALIGHAAVPRYDWRPLAGVYWVRIDRWTGTAMYGRFEPGGTWAPGRDAAAALDAEIDRYLRALPTPTAAK